MQHLARNLQSPVIIVRRVYLSLRCAYRSLFATRHRYLDAPEIQIHRYVMPASDRDDLGNYYNELRNVLLFTSFVSGSFGHAANWPSEICNRQKQSR